MAARRSSFLEPLEGRLLLATIPGVTIEDVSSELATSFDRTAGLLVDGSGLTGNQHGVLPDGSMWLNAGNGCCGDAADPNAPGAVITFDLEDNYDLNSVRVWNYNEVAPFNLRGANNVEILVAADTAGPFTSLGNFTFGVAPGAASYVGETIDLSGFAAAEDVRLVRFDIADNHGDDNDFVGLSEVRFDSDDAPAEQVEGVAVVDFSSQLNGFDRRAEYTVDGSGLTAGQHGITPDGSMWLTQGTFGGGQDPHIAAGDGLLAHITFDLGANYDLENLHVWNYNEQVADLTSRGAQDVEIFASSGYTEPFVSLGDFVFSRASGLTDYAGETIDLSSAVEADDVRLLRIDVATNYGDANSFAGLSEIRFFGHFLPAPMIEGVSVGDVSSELVTSFTRGAALMVDGSGLTDGMHDSTPDGTMWLNAGNGCCGDAADPHLVPGDPFLAHFTLDLPANYDVEGLHIWNYNELNLTSRGANRVEVLVSPTLGGPFVPVGGIDLLAATGTAGDLGQAFDLLTWEGLDNVRSIRFNIVSSHGDANEFVGLSEVHVFGSEVPFEAEPIIGASVNDFSSQIGGFDRIADHAVDGSGLANGRHSEIADGTMWLSQGTFGGMMDPHIEAGDGLLAHVSIDLGANYDLRSLHVWNYNEQAAGLSTRGANDVEILVASGLNEPFVSLGDFNFAQASGLPDYAGEEIALSAADVRVVRFDVSSNHGGDADFVGLSEVRFFGEAVAPAPIAGVSVEEVSSQIAQADRMAVYSVNGSGLFEGGHTIAPNGNMWLSQGTFSGGMDPHIAAGDGLLAHVVYDLEGTYSLDGLHVWNYNETLPNRPELLGRGINEVELLVADDGGPFTSLGVFNFAAAQGLYSYLGESIDLRGLAGTESVRLVRLDVRTNHGGDLSFAGLSEIQFFGDLLAIPSVPGVTVLDVSSELSGFDRLAAYTVDDSGLTDGQHGITPDGTMWLSQGDFGGAMDPHIADGDGLLAHVTYDLGGNYDLSSLHVWNYNEQVNDLTTRGANDVRILVSSGLSDPFVSLGDFQLQRASGLADYAGEDVDLSSFVEADDVRLVRFDVVTNHGDGNSFVGLSEVDFFGRFLPPEAIEDVSVENVSSELSGFDRLAVYTVDRSGLVGDGHGVTPDGAMWLSQGVFGGQLQDPHIAAGDGLLAHITFDLEANYDLNTMRIWNYNEFLPGRTDLLMRGIDRLDILVTSELGGPFTVLGEYSLAMADGTSVYPGESFDLTGIAAADDVRLVRFDIFSNHGGDNSFVGLSEVQFFGDLISVAPIEDVAVLEVSSQLDGFDRQAIYTVDASGLAGGSHGVTPDGTMWLSQGSFGGTQDPHVAAGDGLLAHITYDLGGVYDLDEMQVWNYNEQANGLTTRGIDEMEILVSLGVDEPFVSLGTFNLAQASGQADYTGETIDLSSFAAADLVRLVRFDVVSSHGGDNDFAGLSEVQFFGEFTIEPFIMPVTVAEVSSELGGFDRLAPYTVDQSGLVNERHGLAPTGTMWLSQGSFGGVLDPHVAAADGLLAHITYDLGDRYDLRRFQVWNYNEFLAGRPELLGRGVNELEILVAADVGGPFTTLGQFTFSQADGTVAYAGESIDLRDVPGTDVVRLVRFDIFSNHGGDNDFAGLSEIKFYGEPALSNQPPVADAGGPYVIDEGDSLALDASSSSDPDGDVLTYEWDVNGDGVYGDASGATPLLSWSDLGSLSPSIDDDGSFTVSVRVSDTGGESDTATATLTIGNTTPVIELAGADTAAEGATYTLTLGEVADPGADTVTQWVVDWGDGTVDTFSTGGDVQHTFADGPEVHVIFVSLQDEDGVHDGAGLLDVIVTNLPPSADAGGPYRATQGQSIPLSGSATDPAGAADTLTFLWDLDGDGLFGETGAGALNGDELGQSPTFSTGQLVGPSIHTVRLQVSDEDGGTTTVSADVEIVGSVFIDGDGNLQVVGTDSADRIVIARDRVGLLVRVNAERFGEMRPTGDVIVNGMGGNDVLTVAGNVRQPVHIDGGAGNDYITGGSGDDVLKGGAGNDLILGGAGNNLMDGGTGNDQLVGRDGDDVLSGGVGNDVLQAGGGANVLLGGIGRDRLSGGGHDMMVGDTTDADEDDEALMSLLATWALDIELDTRADMIRQVLSPQADDELDLLYSNGGQDWFILFQDDGDRGVGAGGNDLVDLL